MEAPGAPAPTPPGRRGRRWPWMAAGALVVLVILGGYIFAGTPSYSLYRFTAALQSHDATTALAYVDVDQAAQAATEVVVADFLARQRHPSNVVEAVGQGIARQAALQTVKPQVAARIRAEIGRIAADGSGNAGLPVGLLAVFLRVDVKRDGDQAWVTYNDPRQGPTRFRMSRQPDRSWKIAEFDRDWVRRQVQPHPAR